MREEARALADTYVEKTILHGAEFAELFREHLDDLRESWTSRVRALGLATEGSGPERAAPARPAREPRPRKARAKARVDAAVSEEQVLAEIGSGWRSMSEIARALGTSPGGIEARFKALIAQGKIEKRGKRFGDVKLAS